MLLTENQIDNLKTWSKALRSGKFKQGKGKLRNRDTYCCLGVADVCIFNNSQRNINEIFLPNILFEQLMPIDLCTSEEGIGYDVQRMIGIMNDSEGYSFNDIADLIDFFIEVVIFEHLVEEEMNYNAAP